LGGKIVQNKSDFYEKWAEMEMSNESYRRKNSDWKSGVLYNLFSGMPRINRIAEIGGAEGHVLAGFIQRLGYPVEGINYELANKFIDEGRKRHKKIQFINADITKESINNRFDVIILSDIIEHIEDDELFLEKISKLTRYVLINIPIEKCLHIKFLRSIGKVPPLGMTHWAGHLHDYNIDSAIQLISKYFTVMNSYFEDPRVKMEQTKDLTLFGKIDSGIIHPLSIKCLPKSVHSWVYGGCLFVLGKPKTPLPQIPE
jgi:hypothetical protein